jgi:hypothetical protein
MGKNRHTLEITKLQQKIKTLPIIASAFFFLWGEFFCHLTTKTDPVEVINFMKKCAKVSRFSGTVF